MANFRLVNGMWVRAVEDIQDLKRGHEYQVLYSAGLGGNTVGFVGRKAILGIRDVAKYVEPLWVVSEQDQC